MKWNVENRCSHFQLLAVLSSAIPDWPQESISALCLTLPKIGHSVSTSYLAASSVLATHSITRSTSSVEVCQLQTLTRIARRPRHVVPVKNASPEAKIAAMIRSVKTS